MPMHYTVYMDILFLINFGMDILIIWLTAFICRKQVVWWRCLISALAGSGLFLLLVWLPIPFDWIYYIFCYGGIGGLMCFLAFMPKGIGAILKCYSCQLLVTFVLGGILNWIYFTTPLGSWLNQQFYATGFQLGEWLLLVLFGGMLLILLGTGYRQLQKEQKQDFYQLSLYFEEKNIYGIGFLDTGNFLKDPISGRPVIIAEAEWVYPLLSEGYQQLMNTYINTGKLDYDWIADKQLSKARWIPYQSVGKQQGELLGILCRKIVLKNDRSCMVRESVIVGISRTPISSKHQYQVLLHRDLIE